ncbi:MAG: RNA-binding cell elongation regulator Jag/EloR [Sporolactobacillus sp.]
MREVTKYGKTVNEAVSFALEELNATPDQVTTEVLENPRKGFLGFGVRRALVRVISKKMPFDFGIDYLENVIDKMNINAHLQVVDRSARICHCRFSGRQAPELIGRHGQTLNALQLLANIAVNKQSEHHIQLYVDAANYRQERKAQLNRLAGQMAERVKRTGRDYHFPPMPSFERKIIHGALAGKQKLITFSVGEEPRRYVVIKNKRISKHS